MVQCRRLAKGLYTWSDTQWEWSSARRVQIPSLQPLDHGPIICLWQPNCLKWNITLSVMLTSSLKYWSSNLSTCFFFFSIWFFTFSLLPLLWYSFFSSLTSFLQVLIAFFLSFSWKINIKYIKLVIYSICWLSNSKNMIRIRAIKTTRINK